MKETAIVILNWNNIRQTSRCIESLLRSGNPAEEEIVLVDNGSTDGSGDELRKRYPQVRHLQSGANLGFAGGVNVGLRDAFSRGFQMFVLLNSDMIVQPGFLAPACRILREDQAVGVVTGKVLQLVPPGVIWHAGGHINKLTVAGVSRGNNEQDVGQYDADCDTEWGSGAMCVISRRTIERVGFMPENYFFGQEEWDYSTSVLRHGLRIRYCGAFVGVHDQGSNHKDGHPVLKVYGAVRNRFMYARRNLPPWRVTLFCGYYLIYLVTLWPLRAKYRCKTFRDFWARYRAAWIGYFDQFSSMRVDLETLRKTQERIGASDSWGASWAGE